MKKLLVLSAVAVMALATGPVVHAEDTTKDVDTSNETSEQSGTVWGSITDKDLNQLKVTVPIKIDFIISKGETDGPNKMTVGKYKIIVPDDSEIGAELTNVNIKQSLDSKWNLTADASTETTDVHTVSIELAGAQLKYGDNAITNFEIGVNSSKELNINGKGSKVSITSSEAEASNKAFDIVYTIKQK